jgi:hypothetical protein
MTQQSTQELQRFITENKLRREDGLIVFEASISFTTTDKIVNSELMVVTLPDEMVLYIMECGTSNYPENDMYRTMENTFICLPDKQLEITSLHSEKRVIIYLNTNITAIKK